MLKILTVGDGDLTLSLAIARAYGNHVDLTASVLDSHALLEKAFSDAPTKELAELKVPIIYELDATQLHRRFPHGYWDLVIFHHPHLGLASLGQDEVEHAMRHHILLSHYLHSASQVSRLIHVCLCGTQPQTWKLHGAADRLGLTLLRSLPTAMPFSRIWTEDNVETRTASPEFSCPRRYRNGKLGSRHVLGKYGYRHRRTAGELYTGTSTDMNVAGSLHFVFGCEAEASSSRESDPINLDTKSCSICETVFASNDDLYEHLKAPAKPLVAERSNRTTADQGIERGKLKPVQSSGTKLTSPSGESEICIDESTVDLTGENAQKWIIDESEDSKRLRWFLQHRLKLSKRAAELEVHKGLVYIEGGKALDTSRILKKGMTVVVLKGTDSSKDTGSSRMIEVMHRSEPFLVVSKPAGVRTKGAFKGTLEFFLSEQEGSQFQALSSLDTSCFGTCVMMAYNHLQENELRRPVVQHQMLALVHGRVPDSWFPQTSMEVDIQRKWSKRKFNQVDSVDGSSSTINQSNRTQIHIFPLERTVHSLEARQEQNGSRGPSNLLALSSVRIQTQHPSTASICQWMRRAGYPVVGDTNCRREYLQLRRSIRNRIKDKLCIGCFQVTWDYGGKHLVVPDNLPVIPEKLSAKYWEDNFGDVQETNTGTL